MTLTTSDSIQELTVEQLRAKVGTGMEIVDAEEHMLLSMGPQHPSTHGVLRLLVELDGETVVNLANDIGFLHTGVEKSMESRFCHRICESLSRIWIWGIKIGKNYISEKIGILQEDKKNIELLSHQEEEVSEAMEGQEKIEEEEVKDADANKLFDDTQT